MADAEQNVKDQADVRVDLAEIKTDLGWIKKAVNDHLHEHVWLSRIIFTGLVGLVASLIGIILKIS